MNCDTIAAIATGSSPCAIGIIRLSGPRAIQAVEAVFSPAGGGSLTDHSDRTLIYGVLRDADGAVIDRPLVTISHGPRSYTGEDTSELQCHGSPTVLGLALEALYAQGVRPARAGEFTRRAFLNGKMDLTQAEAVVDLIDAETAPAVRQAAGQLGGALSRRIDRLYHQLVDLLAHFHAVVDYPDEDIAPTDAVSIAQQLDGGRKSLDQLLETYRRGSFLTQGIPCAIAGRPNAGKSSLLNGLLGYERAIVTDRPGTTRDTVEERLKLGGLLLKLIDTAGLRAAGDEAERLGVERSRKAVEAAQLCLVVVDGSRPPEQGDDEAFELSLEAPRRMIVCNKSDLPVVPQWAEWAKARGSTEVTVSALTGEGLEQLERAIAALFEETAVSEAGELLTNGRQAEAAARASECLTRASTALTAGVTLDAVLSDVEEGLHALGELNGRTVREDIVNRVFERFCVGK